MYIFLFFPPSDTQTIVLQQCSALPRTFYFIFFFLVFSFLQEDITYQSASRDLSKSLLNNFSTQRKNIKQNVKFGSHIFYPFPTRNTRSYESNNIYNVCNNTEINIKKRCYTKQVYIISNFSIILFSIKGNVFSSELAT